MRGNNDTDEQHRHRALACALRCRLESDIARRWARLLVFETGAGGLVCAAIIGDHTAKAVRRKEVVHMSGFFYWCVSPSLVLALTAAWTRAGNKLDTLPSLPEPVAGSQASVCSRLRAYTEHGLAMHSEGPRSVTSVRSPELKPPGLPLITGVLAPVCAEKPALRPRTDNPTPRGLEAMRASEPERHWRRRVYWYLSPF